MRFSADRGDGAALLSFDVDADLAPSLAGFAVECVPPSGDSYPVLNRLSFEQEITKGTTPQERMWTPTSEAPLQKFHWIHYPKDVPAGTFTYKATAMLFAKASGTELEPGPEKEVSLELREEGFRKFEVGFTRGSMSSQAYADRFENKPVAPDPQTAVFDTGPFEERYRWLGAHARKLVFGLLEETANDPELSLDVFAYDLDEPDMVRAFAALGSRLRLFLDDSDIKKGTAAAKRKAEAVVAIAASVSPEKVKRGSFSRYAHDKVLIQKRGEEPVKVLSGSANFSVRGLFVQSNNVFVFDDPAVAAVYEQAFDKAWKDPRGFSKSPISAQWFPEKSGGGDSNLPDFQVSFAPHADSEIFLQPVADAIAEAKSSVLFSIMDIDQGSGPVLKAIKELPGKDLYAFGTTQDVAAPKENGGVKVRSPGAPEVFIPFDYLRKTIPAPFRPFQPETRGGEGQIIHHKFVVVDFNDENPAVFAGSSNLTDGGEKQNGDNLLAFRDPKIASTYAVEAIRLIDHYRFRAAMHTATEDKPLRLKSAGAKWAEEYFEPGTVKLRERELFAKQID